MRPDIVPGAKFPDYELTDHTPTHRKLSALQGNDPMILILSRGHFCPKDHQQHLELAAFYPRIAVAYTQFVTISTDNLLEPTSSGTLLARNGRSSRILAGKCRKISTSRNTPTLITTR